MHPPRIIPSSRVLRSDVAPPRRFFAGLTLGAAALSLVLATALPARADKDDLAKALLGIIVLGAIAHELNADDRAPPPPDHRKPPRSRDRLLPSVCAIEIDGRRGGTVFPESCLRDEGLRGPLPRHCGHEARVWGRWDTIYGLDCLRDAGFRLRGRHGHRD